MAVAAAVEDASPRSRDESAVGALPQQRDAGVAVDTQDAGAATAEAAARRPQHRRIAVRRSADVRSRCRHRRP